MPCLLFWDQSQCKFSLQKRCFCWTYFRIPVEREVNEIRLRKVGFSANWSALFAWTEPKTFLDGSHPKRSFRETIASAHKNERLCCFALTIPNCCNIFCITEFAMIYPLWSSTKTGTFLEHMKIATEGSEILLAEIKVCCNFQQQTAWTATSPSYPYLLCSQGTTEKVDHSILSSRFRKICGFVEVIQSPFLRNSEHQTSKFSLFLISEFMHFLSHL